MSDEAPAKRPGGRPRKHPPAPPPAPRLDPRRFAAAYAAHLMKHNRVGPTQAAKIAALIFLPGFKLAEQEFAGQPYTYADRAGNKPRQRAGHSMNASARLPASADPQTHLNYEGRSIRESLARMKADPAKADWLDMSVMLLGILFSGSATPAQLQAIGPMIRELGWDTVLPALIAAANNSVKS